MPFEKGNNLWKKGIEAKKENKEVVTNFFKIVASGGIKTYGEKLGKLALDEGLGDNEKQFMDRFEKLIPYVKPLLNRTEHTGKDGKPIEHKLMTDEELVKVSNG